VDLSARLDEMLLQRIKPKSPVSAQPTKKEPIQKSKTKKKSKGS
jgi:hypothetical protein